MSDSGPQVTGFCVLCVQLTRERDSLRAEVERLKACLDEVADLLSVPVADRQDGEDMRREVLDAIAAGTKP